MTKRVCSRGFVFSADELLKEEIHRLRHCMNSRYLCYCYHPEVAGRESCVRGYIYFRNPRDVKALSRLMGWDIKVAGGDESNYTGRCEPDCTKCKLYVSGNRPLPWKRNYTKNRTTPKPVSRNEAPQRDDGDSENDRDQFDIFLRLKDDLLKHEEWAGLVIYALHKSWVSKEKTARVHRHLDLSRLEEYHMDTDIAKHVYNGFRAMDGLLPEGYSKIRVHDEFITLEEFARRTIMVDVGKKPRQCPTPAKGSVIHYHPARNGELSCTIYDKTKTRYTFRYYTEVYPFEAFIEHLIFTGLYERINPRLL